MVAIRDLRDMRRILDGYRNNVPGTLRVTGVERNFSFEVRWYEPEKVAIFVGHMPEPNPGTDEYWLSQDPLVYRKHIKRNVSFEFWIEPQRLADPIDQLDALLKHLGAEAEPQE